MIIIGHPRIETTRFDPRSREALLRPEALTYRSLYYLWATFVVLLGRFTSVELQAIKVHFASACWKYFDVWMSFRAIDWLSLPN